MTEISLIAQNVINFVNQTQKSIFLTGKASSSATTTNGKNTYIYKYDRLSRITDAHFAGANSLGITTKMYNGSTSYDANGNIQYMSRAVGGVNKDILNYTYTNGNQLGNVTDAGDITSLFKGKAGGGGYTYDANGNMTADGNKDLTINYNYLNLPGTITRTAGATGYVKNYYAGATKIRSVNYTAATNKTKTYDYIAGMVYAQEDALAPKTLDFVATPEGRAMSTKTLLGLSAEPLTGDKFRYEYNLKDHLGNLRVSCRCDEIKRDANGLPYPETDANYGFIPLKAVQEIAYDPWGLNFGNTTDSQKPSVLTDRFQYNGKEKLLDLDLGWSDYGARMYMSEMCRWGAIDPLAHKYPSMSPYVFSANNPIYYVDPDGREPVHSIYALKLWFSLKLTQWYSTAGVYDSKSFNAAASYSTQHLKSDAFQSVYQRNSYYGWAQGQADAKGYGSKWFGAAQLVTGLRAVGGTEIPDGGLFSSSAVDKFLQGGNKFLFSHNMKNAKDLLADGKLSGGFTDANGAKQSFEGLTGMALDNKMVEFEQSKVQEYIGSYKGNDLNSIITGINDLMSGFLGPGAVKDVMKDSFNGGKSFNFKSYEDRVKLGQELIKKAHNE
jgi:RHS repeat-associated protein